MDELIEVCIPHMVKDGFTAEQAREYMQQPVSLDEMIRRNPRQSFPMSEENYRQLRFTRPDLWNRCLFCPAQGKAYFLDPDYLPDRRILEHRNK